MGRRAWTAFVAIALAAAAGCGGPDVPTHNGYRSAKARPWRSPVVLKLDESLEAEVDDAVSYPKQQRARWYAIDLPGSGELEVKVAVAAELTEERDSDVAFEVLDEGYRILAKADREEDDAGDEQKVRVLKGLTGGRYYVHIYAPRRLDEAEFTLQAIYRPRAVTERSNFPASVAFIGALPNVPTDDDGPPPVVAKKCKGARCRKRVEEKVVEEEAPSRRPTLARISGIVDQGRGVQVRINQGSNQGIEVGWKGTVVSRDGKPIPGGSFEITKVSPGESFGIVKANADSITSAKYVRLQRP